MVVRFYNTLSGRVEEFTSLEPGRVRMYTCGPTVYDYPHIGNYRTFVFQDILRRFLKYAGYELKHVMNLTDVDDKIIRNAGAAGLSLSEYTEKYVKAFEEDSRLLNLERPEIVVRATEHINDMVALVQRLEQAGYTYRSDGSIYYRIAKFRDYGKLSKIDMSGIKAGARVDVDEYEKSDPRDFALWKAPKPAEAGKPGEFHWETPLGPGRPGWHIECSVMSMKYLGETLDIHTGGVDLVFPHHENEIAQSEAATGKPFVRYWLHAEHLLVEGEKMAKSKGNFFTLRDLFARGYKPSAIRYLLASVPYRKQLNFTFDGLHQAASSVERLRNFVWRLENETFPPGSNPAMAALADQALNNFEEALADDLNTAEALAAIFDLVRNANTAMDRGEFRADEEPRMKRVLTEWDKIFAVIREDLTVEVTADSLTVAVGSATVETLSDEEVKRLLVERAEARARGQYARSDEIRRELTDRGIIVEDTKDGVRWKRR